MNSYKVDFSSLIRLRFRAIDEDSGGTAGFACLSLLAQHHGIDVSVSQLRRRHKGADRTSLADIQRAAEALQLQTRVVRIDVGLASQLRLPAILQRADAGFAILERADGRRLLIHEPGRGARWMSVQELKHENWPNALEAWPVHGFKKPVAAPDRVRLADLWQNVSGLKRAAAQTLLLSLVLQVYVVASPYFMQAAIDYALPALDIDLLTVIAIGYALLTLVNVAAGYLRSLVIVSTAAILGFGISTKLAAHLFRLPTSWFQQRHLGDIMSRFQSIRPIQDLLSGGGVATIIDGAMTVITLAVMLIYSLKLTLIALFALTLYLLARWIAFAAQRRAQEKAIVAGGLEQSIFIESVRGISVLRSMNKEMIRHRLWSDRLITSIRAQYDLNRIGFTLSAVSGLVMGLEAVASLWISISMVMGGTFTIGMVFAFLAYKSQFLSRAGSLIDQITVMRMIGLHLDRISDIAVSPEDECHGENSLSFRELGGRIEARDLIFQYPSAAGPVLWGLNFSVPAGGHVAITGPSASGKTTLVKLLLGLAKPTGGDLFVDGVSMETFGYQQYREQVGSVLQDDMLFTGTIADNITFFDSEAEAGEVARVAKLANIHDEIQAMPLGYDTPIAESGAALSGGQRQRLLLARALFRRPKVLIMDEGTAHLDAVNETAINQSISAMGITRIIIAHRAETLAAADKVYVMRDGKLHESRDAPQL